MTGISVVIPTYNEAAVIAGLIHTVVEEVSPLEEIIVADDDSPDGTWRVVEELARVDPRIKLIRRRARRGLAASIAEGIAACRGTHVFWFDADFCSPAGTLAALCAARGDADIVFASRYAAGGRDGRRERWRAWVSAIFNRWARAMLATRSRDLTSGQAIVRRKVFETVSLRGEYGEYFIRFIAEAERGGWSVREMPFTTFSRPDGDSKSVTNPGVFLRHGARYMATVIAVRAHRS